MSHPADNSGVLKAVDERVAYERVQLGAEMQTQIDQLAVQVLDRDATIRDLRIANDVVTADLDAEREWRAEHMATQHPAPGPTTADLRAVWGVCIHPNFATKPAYSDPDKVMRHVRDAGHTMIRGMLANPAKPGSLAWKNCLRTLQLCREYKIKWLMTLVPEDWSVSPAEAAAKIKWLADNDYGDVVLAFEGPNEPAHARGGGTVPSDWHIRTLNAQKAIHAAARQHFPDVLVLGPAMHDIQEDNNNGAGYRKLADIGIAQYVDRISMHSYPKGSTVDTGFEPRLELARIAYPAPMKVWVTETGWTTYPRRSDGPRGPQPTTEEDAARYGAEAPGIIWAHPEIEKAFRYEGEDDPLPADLSQLENPERAEACYGEWRANGTPKPEAIALQAVLTD